MQFGIEAGIIPSHLPYSSPIQEACQAADLSPALAYGIAFRESIRGELAGLWTAATVVSGDGGYGLFQLTSSYPKNWDQPRANADWALSQFIKPALTFFSAQGLTGEALIRCIAAAFNAGLETAWEAHNNGNVDACTTGCDYAADVFAIYSAIIAGRTPQ